MLAATDIESSRRQSTSRYPLTLTTSPAGDFQLPINCETFAIGTWAWPLQTRKQAPKKSAASNSHSPVRRVKCFFGAHEFE